MTVHVSYPWEVHVLLNISIALCGSSHPVSFVSLLITIIEFILLYLIKYQHLTSIIYFIFFGGGGGILSSPSGNQVLQHLFSSALVYKRPLSYLKMAVLLTPVYFYVFTYWLSVKAKWVRANDGVYLHNEVLSSLIHSAGYGVFTRISQLNMQLLIYLNIQSLIL